MNDVLHWLNIEYWGASWPNIFAPSVWTLLGIGLSHWRLHRKMRQHHDEHMNAIRDLAPGTRDKDPE